MALGCFLLGRLYTSAGMVHLGRDSCPTCLSRGQALSTTCGLTEAKPDARRGGVVGATPSIHLAVTRRKARYNIPSGTSFRPFNGPPAGSLSISALAAETPLYYAARRFFDADDPLDSSADDDRSTTANDFYRTASAPFRVPWCFDWSTSRDVEPDFFGTSFGWMMMDVCGVFGLFRGWLMEIFGYAIL